MSFYCFFDVGNGLLLRLGLADAARQAGALSNSVTTFAGNHDDLSHDPILSYGLDAGGGTSAAGQFNGRRTAPPCRS